MTDVFVSYKAEDRRRVEPLVRALESDGVSVWWDAHIGGGDEWRQTILRELERAKCVIVVWSKRSVGPDGNFVRDEAARALKRKTYLPVRIDKVDPPLGFGEMQALELAGWKGDDTDPRFRALLEAVRNRIGVATAPAEGATHSAVSRRGALAAGGGVLALAAAGGTAWWFARPAAAANSIAVLPFANLSGDPNETYFSDGIAEELRSALSRIAGLKVVARTSSEAVRNEDAKTAASKLSVKNILTGSVRRSPSLIRISAQLIDGRDGTERWSQDYDRPAGDALQIQSDIAQRVASALELQLVPAAGGRLIAGGTTNPRAHDLFLQGLATRQGRHTSENLLRAVQLLDEAIRLDPSYAEAYAIKAIALSEWASGFASSGAELRDGLSRASAAAQRAIALSPDLPMAHAALAHIAVSRIQFTTGVAEFEKAASAERNAVILGDYGRFLAQLGFADRAHVIGKQVIALDPLNSRSYTVDAAAYYSARRFPEAITTTEKILSLAPGVPVALVQVADCLIMLGKYDEARAVLAQIPGDDAFRLTTEGILDERMGNHSASGEAVQKLQLMFGSAVSYQLAQLQAQRGQADAAFAALDEAVALPDGGLVSLLVDPYLDPLRKDPRFSRIRSKISFPAGLPA
jgi:serine/threonine-protein kinase